MRSPAMLLLRSIFNAGSCFMAVSISKRIYMCCTDTRLTGEKWNSELNCAVFQNRDQFSLHNESSVFSVFTEVAASLTSLNDKPRAVREGF